MNYVQEMSCFYSWIEWNPLTPSSINLWHALMHMHHKAGEIEIFSVAESVLCIKTNLTSRTLRKARKELKEKGRIDYLSKQGKAPVYRIIPFQNKDDSREKNKNGDFPGIFLPKSPGNDITLAQTSESYSEVHTQPSSLSVQTSERNAEDDSNHHSSSETNAEVHAEPLSRSENLSAVCSALFKQQPTDKQLPESWNDVIETWTSVFGFALKPNHMQMLSTYMNVSQMSKPLILEAIERVKQAAKPALNYLWTILSNWSHLGLQTIQDLVNHEKRRMKNKQPARQSQLYHTGRDISRSFQLDLTEGEDW
ncbi:DnaD domain-containing protein [Niallia endozanthoxylica]|nr:DnaD domain protein [Niallia endozanthoxylica]